MAEPKPIAPAAPAAPPREVLVKSATGEVGTVPESDLGQLVESGGSVYTPEEQAADVRREKYGGAGGAAVAGGLGLAHGLTFGLGTAAAGALGGAPVKEYIRGHEEENPVPYAVGDVTGMILPTVVSGGTGLGARAAIRGAGLIPRLAQGAGLAAEGAIGRAIGSGAENVLVRAAQRGAGMAAQAGVESALMGVGNQLSEDVLGDHEVTGERLLAAGVRDFVSGAKIGGALGVGGTVLGRALGRGAERAVDAIDAETLAYQHAGEALGTKMQDLKRLAKKGEGIEAVNREIGKVALEEGIVTRDIVKKVDMAKEASRVEKEVLGRIEKLHKDLNAQGKVADMQPVWQKIDDTLEELSYMKRVELPLKAGQHGPASIEYVRTARPGMEDAYHEFKSYADNLKDYMKADASGAQVPFSKMFEARVLLDKKLAPAWKNPQLAEGAGTQKLMALRGVMEDAFESQSDDVMKLMDPSFADKYAEAKNTYRRVKQMEQILHRESAREMANQTFSLKDQLSSHIGSGIGASVGALGGPLGTAAGAVVGGAAGAMVNKFMRERGHQIAADILGKAADMKKLANTTSTLSRNIEDAVNGFMSEKGVYKAAAAAHVIRDAQERKPPSKKDFQRISERIQNLASNPQALAEQTVAALPPGIERVAPKSVTAAQETAKRRNDYLLDKLPKISPSGNYFQTTLGKPRLPSDTDIAKFYKFVHGAEDAYAIIEASRKGQLSREIVDAAKHVYPSIFEQFRAAFIKSVSKKKKQMSQQQRTAMAMMFDVPVDATHEPDFIRTVQDMYAENASPEPGEGGQTPLAPKRGINVSGSYETAMQQLESA